MIPMASKSHFPELGNNPSVVSACCGRTKNVYLMSINMQCCCSYMPPCWTASEWRKGCTNSFHEMKFSSFNFRLRSIISSIEPRLSVWAVPHSSGDFSPRHTTCKLSTHLFSNYCNVWELRWERCYNASLSSSVSFGLGIIIALCTVRESAIRKVEAGEEEEEEGGGNL